jgi:hypothetical protein
LLFPAARANLRRYRGSRLILMRVAFCTIVAKRDIALARATARSFSTFHPEIPFFTLVIDANDGFFTEDAEPFTTLYLADLGAPDFAHLRFRYDAQQLAYAATPLLLGHLLGLGYEVCCFIKQESLFFGPCEAAIARCATQSVTLAAHHIAPTPGADGPRRELTTLLSGVYNSGFVAVSACDEAHAFLAWWGDRLAEHCVRDVAEGLHFEQRWLDLVPCYFANSGVIRDPGFNVGHWRLPEQAVRIAEGAITVDGQPCSLVRFSGYDFDAPERATRYFDRLSVEGLGDAAQLFRAYRAALVAEHYPTTRHWPYSYAFFSNAVPVPPIAKEIYRSLAEAQRRFSDPLAAEPRESFFRWLNGAEETDAPARPRLTRLWRAIYRERPDLQQSFPDIDGADRSAYVAWTGSQGAAELGVATAFIHG